MPAAGVAIFKGHFTIHQITKKTVALWVFLATVVHLRPTVAASAKWRTEMQARDMLQVNYVDGLET